MYEDHLNPVGSSARYGHLLEVLADESAVTTTMATDSKATIHQIAFGKLHIACKHIECSCLFPSRTAQFLILSLHKYFQWLRCQLTFSMFWTATAQRPTRSVSMNSFPGIYTRDQRCKYG